MSKSSSEQTADFLLGLLPSLLPKPVDSVAKSAIDTFRGPLDSLLSQPRLKKDLLEAAQKAESDFRAKAKEHLKSDELTQAVASFPLFDRELFQSTLQSLPEHLNEDFLASHLQTYIADDWKGKFTPAELREGMAIYLNCLRIQLLKVEGFADLVTRLATLRTDERSEQILAIVKELVGLVNQLLSLNHGESQVSAPNQLPADINFFSGRKSEIKELEDVLLRKNSIVSIYSVWGMGGIGKSALAIHVATNLYLAGNFQDGVLWADLRMSSVDDTLTNFIRAFGYTEDQVPQKQADKASFKKYITRKKALVFLDNALSENDVIPFFVNEPTVSFVITSRKQLLGITDYSAYLKDLDVFSLEDSLELIQMRTGPRYQNEPDAAKKICELAGNLPLAVSIAAARLSDEKRWPTLQMFAERLQDVHKRLDELKGSTKEKDLRAVFSVSYDSLGDIQKKNFSFLSLFESVNFGSSGFMALFKTDKQQSIDQLNDLVDLSLLLRSELGGYRFHDLLLLFSIERRQIEYSENEVAEAKSRIDEYTQLLTTARKLGARASSSVRRGNLDQGIAFYSQAQEINLQIHSRSGQASALGGLASAYAQKGDLDKAIELHSQSIILSKEIGNRSGQASALGGLASAYAQKGDLDKAIELHSQSIILSKEIGNRSGQASALGGLASAYADKGNWENAFQSYDQAYTLNLEIGDLMAQAKALGGLASSSQQLEKWERVVEYQEKALVISESLHDFRGQEKAVGGIAFAYSKLNQLEKSIEYQFKALDINKKINNPKGEAKAYGALASAFQRQGKYVEAIDYYLKAQEINHKTRDVKGQARALGGIASIYYNQKKWALAIPFLEQALELNKKIRDRFIHKTLFQLAVSYMNTGDKQKAKKYAQEANEVTKGKDEKINNLLKTLE